MIKMLVLLTAVIQQEVVFTLLFAVAMVMHVLKTLVIRIAAALILRSPVMMVIPAQLIVATLKLDVYTKPFAVMIRMFALMIGAIAHKDVFIGKSLSMMVMNVLKILVHPTRVFSIPP